MPLSTFLDDRIKKEDPLRKVANAVQTRRVRRILNDIQGIGCRVIKDTTKEGHGWRIVVDGTGTDIPFPDGTSPFDHSATLYCVFYFTKTGDTTGTWTQGKGFVGGVDTTITDQPTTITTTVSQKYWIKHTFADDTLVWQSGASYPSATLFTDEIFRMLEITCAAGVITSFVNTHPCDIYTITNPINHADL